MDSALNQAFEAILTQAKVVQANFPVMRGPLQSGAGIALEPDPSGPTMRHMDGGIILTLDIVMNGKATDRRTLTNALHLLHSVLTRKGPLPQGRGWQITHIDTQTFPALVERQKDGQWLYASSLTATIYIN